jgi:tetrahydromethanopterin S-methyltransferase subunit G
MATLDRVMQMQSQGMSDSDIIYTLQNEGINPQEINDSLAQAKIKTAVSQPAPKYAPSPQEAQQQMPQDQYAAYPQTPQAYGDQQYYYPEQPSMNIDTISEIVDRILIEKIKDIINKIKAVTDFKVKAEEDIKDLKQRLGTIESSIENLQRSIIGKVGEFGESTQLIHRDIENLHGTVSKLMNPLVDNYNELKRLNSRR